MWVDERQAEYLGYGSHIQQLETDNILRALHRNTYHSEIIANQDQVFAAVKWSIQSQLGFASEVFRVDEGTDMSLTTFSETSEFPSKAECLVIAKTYGLGQCNVLPLVQNRDRAYSKALPAVWSGFSPLAHAGHPVLCQLGPVRAIDYQGTLLPAASSLPADHKLQICCIRPQRAVDAIESLPIAERHAGVAAHHQGQQAPWPRKEDDFAHSCTMSISACIFDWK